MIQANWLTRRFNITALTVLMLIGVATLVLAAYQIRTELKELEEASSDNVQWNLSQLEADLLQLRVALGTFPEAAELGQVRRRFDLLVSRINTLTEGRISDELHTNAIAAAALARLENYVSRTVPLIDSWDAALRTSLPEIASRTELIQSSARTLAIEGIAIFARQSTEQRSFIASLLARVGFLAGTMLVALAGVLSILFRQFGVAERESAQRQQVNARLASTVGASLDAVIVADRDGTIVDFNGAASSIFGYSPEEAIGQKMAPLIIPEASRKAHYEGMHRYLETGEKHVIDNGLMQLTALHKDGHEFPVEVSIAAASGPQGTIFVSFIRDISARLEAEQDLRTARDSALAAERAKSNFLAVMSHEMRTPLNGIMGTLDLMGETRLDHEQARYVDVAKTSGQLLLRHINDVLDISKSEAGKLELNEDVFPPARIAEEVVSINQSLAARQGNTLSIANKLKPGELCVGDSFRLRQILFNLVGNACKFTQEGVITVIIARGKLESGELAVVFRVADTGIGIPPEDQDRVFDDFVTVDASYERRSDGTGLGLGICRRMTKAMGGEIGLSSDFGVGSTFWIKMPYRKPTNEEMAAFLEEEQPKITGPVAAMDILLVEDNEINRFVARRLLESLGHSVTEAENGRLGVDAADARAYDVILMDVSMPVMDGVTATRTIRQGDGRSAKVPIVGLTAHVLNEELNRFREAGMNDCLNKPIDRDRLGAVLARYAKPVRTTAETDQAVIDDLRQMLGDTKFAASASKFIDEVDTGLAEIALMNGNAGPEVQAHIHRLAGSAGTFGAKALRKRLAEMETACKEADPTAFAELAQGLPEIWQACRDVYCQHVEPIH